MEKPANIHTKQQAASAIPGTIQYVEEGGDGGAQRLPPILFEKQNSTVACELQANKAGIGSTFTVEENHPATVFQAWSSSMFNRFSYIANPPRTYTTQ